jgi:anti-sigma B factor antagonist
MSTKVSTINNLEIAVVEPRGSLVGGEETDDLKRKILDLTEQGNKKLIIDLSNVAYLNSAGLGALVQIYTTYTRNGGVVKLCGLEKSVRNIFVMTKLMSVFDVATSRKEAISSLQNR